MSDSSQGPGWWQASDGKWYAPEQHPQAAPPQAPFAPPPAAATPFGSPADATKKPWWRRWWVIAIGVGLALLVVGGIVGNNRDDDGGEPEASAPAVTEPDGADAEEAPSPATTVAGADDADDAEPPPPPDTVDTTAPVDTTPAAATGTRDDPFRIGEPVSVTLDALGDADGSVWTIVVDGPGTDVTESVRQESPFNEPPPEDSIFFGVPVSMTLESANKEPLSTLFNLELEFYGAATASIIDQGFDEGCGLAPGAIDPLKEVFVGGTVSGIVCLAVTEADIDAGVLLTTDSGEGDRIFFATSGDPLVDPSAVTEEPTPTSDADADAEAGAGSRSNPLGIGESATITLDALGDADGSVWTIGAYGAGTDITAAIIAENPFNEPPPDGSVYFGVPVTLTLEEAAKEPLSLGLNLELEFFGSSTLSVIDWGVGTGCGITPGGLDPFKEVFVGGSVSGVLCLPVTRADIDAGVLLTTDSGDGDRIYFATS